MSGKKKITYGCINLNGQAEHDGDQRHVKNVSQADTLIAKKACKFVMQPMISAADHGRCVGISLGRNVSKAALVTGVVQYIFP